MDPCNIVKEGSFGQVWIKEKCCIKTSDLLLESSHTQNYYLGVYGVRELFILTRNQLGVSQASLEQRLGRPMNHLLNLNHFSFDKLSKDERKAKIPKLSLYLPKYKQDLDEWLITSTPRSRMDAFPRIVLDLTLALFILHQRGISHRDLKLANILVTETKTFQTFTICDFGCGSQQRKISFDNYDQSRSIGTQWYLPPELLEPASLATTPSFSSDMWSLGIILLEMLFGSSLETIRSSEHERSHIFHNTWLFCIHPAVLHKKLHLSHWLPALWNSATLCYKGLHLANGFSFEKYGQQTLDFIAKLLLSDYTNRPSAWSMLQHPFIQNNPQLAASLKHQLHAYEINTRPDAANLTACQSFLMDKNATCWVWKSRLPSLPLTHYGAALNMINVDKILPFGPYRWYTGNEFRNEVYEFVGTTLDVIFKNSLVYEEMIFAVGDFLDAFLMENEPIRWCGVLFDQKLNYFWTASLVIFLISQWFMRKDDVQVHSLLNCFALHVVKSVGVNLFDWMDWMRMNSQHAVRVFFFDAVYNLVEQTQGRMVISRLGLFPYLGANKVGDQLFYSKTSPRIGFMLFKDYFLSIKV
jgi:serine/threonine protein kinase